MLRMELDHIQIQLKTAIQNHQILVSQLQLQPQETGLKTKLHNLQKEIIFMCKKQKLVVEKLGKDLIEKKPNTTPYTQTNLQVVTKQTSLCKNVLSDQVVMDDVMEPQETQCVQSCDLPQCISDQNADQYYKSSAIKTNASSPLRVPQYPVTKPPVLQSVQGISIIHMESVRPSHQPTHYLVEEEYTVGVPLVRPKSLFLEILRGAGATGEIFTKKEICNFLKTYIGSRRLFDAEDPRVVHCSGDLLGAVFDVESFTIGDVLKLIEENITHVPDTCLKTKTHFVKKPLPVSTTSSHHISNKLGGVSQTVSRKPSSSSALETDETDDVSSCENSVSCTSETVILSDNSLSSLALDKKSKKKKKKKKKKQKPRKRKSEDQPGPSSKRSRSVSITYGDGEGGDYIHVEDDDDDDEDDVGVGHNCQEVGSAIDDLWYFDEGSVTLDLESDPPFSESDISSVRSGEELLVVCQESDVEFFADYSDTDSNSDDREYTQADNWTCFDCDLSNPPYQRFCNKCWKLRPDWLPRQQTSPDSKSNRIRVEKLIEDSIELKGKAVLRLFNSNIEGTDSGIGSLSSQQSSQESEHFSSTHTNNKDDLILSASLLQEETSACGIRHSFSNYQSKLLSPSSKLSTSLSSSTSVDSLCPQTTVQGHDPMKDKCSPLDGPCIICLTNPKTASFIHGSSGHQVCCFSCAKRLKRRGKACPVCRRPIQKVVKNYIL